MNEKALSFFRERKRSYQQGFGSETTALMMADLARFCRADRSCFDPDPRIHAALEGRREVWLRIQQHLTKTPEEMIDLYGAIETEGDTDA
jgi:predicted alpha/beta hydrolase